MMQAPVVVMSKSTARRLGSSIKLATPLYITDQISADTQNGDRQVGRKAQMSNITAAKT